MSQILLDVPDESLLALHATSGQAGQVLLLAAAVKLYELGRLSSGAAARLAGLPRVAFLQRLADYGVDAFRLTEAELASDLRSPLHAEMDSSDHVTAQRPGAVSAAPSPEPTTNWRL